MKKSVLLLGIAALALAACSRTNVVVTETPTAISFKAATVVPVKADAQLEDATLNTAYSIYASATQRKADGTVENAAYFQDLEFTTADDPVTAASIYKANPTVYWPVGNAVIDFLAYAIPAAKHGAPIVAVYDDAATNVANRVSFTWDTYPADNQVDLLYAVSNSANTTDNAGAGKSVAFEFNHAQALIVFEAKVNVPDVLTINSITFPDLLVSGTFTVDNRRNTLIAEWSGLSEVAGEDKIAEGANAAADGIGEALDANFVGAYAQLGSSLLIPEQPRINFVLNYTIGANTMTYTYNDARGTWKKGGKYVYQLDFQLNEIELTQEVEPYVVESVAEPLS